MTEAEILRGLNSFLVSEAILLDTDADFNKEFLRRYSRAELLAEELDGEKNSCAGNGKKITPMCVKFSP